MSEHHEHFESVIASAKKQFFGKPTAPSVQAPMSMRELETTQHSESLQFDERAAGRSALLARNWGKEGADKNLRSILRSHGGAVHNEQGSFTLPANKVHDFHKAASSAGFQHGHHYSMDSREHHMTSQHSEEETKLKEVVPANADSVFHSYAPSVQAPMSMREPPTKEEASQHSELGYGPLHDRRQIHKALTDHGYKPHKKDNFNTTWHPDGHLTQHYSDDSWKHIHKNGKVKEGKGHAALVEHLKSVHAS